MKFILLSFIHLSLLCDIPKLFLLKTYENDSNVTSWVMSEKYDGVRALWDGNKLVSRSGKVFTSPAWFTSNFPKFALDGELWTHRSDFENIVSIVNTKDSGLRWKDLNYMVFEVPDQNGNLFMRLDVLKNYLEQTKIKHLKLIKQMKIKKQEDVKKFFDLITIKGGEGIVIRNPFLPYYTGRKKSALKLKPFIDAECRVVSILNGNGKFIGKMGSLECDFNGNVIKVGSGFTREERNNPPKIGIIITFKYYGLTSLGNPKYPVFLRIRHDAALNIEPKNR